MDAPIKYAIGGLLGDFFYMLGVCHCMFLKTNRKAKIYLTEQPQYGVVFRRGISQAYNDLYSIVKNQHFVDDFILYDNTPLEVDLNLSTYRDNPLIFKANWYIIFKTSFNVEWGKLPWIHVKQEMNLQSLVLFHCSMRHRPELSTLKKCIKQFSPNIMFVTDDVDEYNDFKTYCEEYLPLFLVNSLHQLASAISSCKMFIGNLSAPLAIAHALHKPNLTLLTTKTPDHIHHNHSSIINSSIQLVY
jgi:hypothetical protein